MIIDKKDCVSTPPYNKGFTLAEVLITLVIIGVVAALTVPTMIAKYHEQQTVTKVKKFQSTISSALYRAIAENGTVDTWDYEGGADDTPVKLVEYFKPYLNIMKDCGAEYGCFYDGDLISLNGTGNNGNYDKYTDYYKLILNDGTTMAIRGDHRTEHCKNNSECGAILVDINGKNKPNIIGKDVFEFAIYKDKIGTHTSDSCKLTGSGWNCAKHILLYENMNYPAN
ncbi:type II secretion system protein [bacterium]|nr:type II secretion system protein [bacterium]